MAIDRFQNTDILITSKVPVNRVQTYEIDDLANLSPVEFTLNRFFYDTQTITEKHIYSADTLVASLQEVLTYEQVDGGTNILVSPEADIRTTGLGAGYYSVVYNFVKAKTPELKIVNVSSDLTEIELEVDNPNYNLQGLFDRINLQLANSTTRTEMGLNFGNNDISIITDVSFHNNPRVGEQVTNVYYPLDEFNGEETRFVPSNEGRDVNQWIEFYKNKKNNAYGNLVYKTTGRSAKFNLRLDSNGNPYYEIEKDSSNEPIYYTSVNVSEPDREYDVPAAEYYNRPPINASARSISWFTQYSRVRYYSPAFKQNEMKSIIVKLYKPLPDGFLSRRCTVDEIIRESYIDRVLAYDTDVKSEQQNFSAPNFKIDMGNYGKSNGTDLKTWNTLLDANLNTSQKIIDKYISSSFGGTDLNIDYTYFGNFVKYSSAVERVNNFKYKLELIESYNARISDLNSVSGSEALTNISQSITRRDNVVSGMDGWERWMYNESEGSLYTHYSSSNYPLEPWPKSSTYPNVNYSVTSSEGIAAYNGLIDSASIYDALNDARLTKTIPASITEDALNQEYVLFIDMIGHHFDITWSYINALTSINEREEHPYDGMPNNLLYDVAKTMGWRLTHGKDTSDLWEFGLGTDKFGNTPNSGSLPSKPHEQINNEVWRRIVNNIPYLLKTKGSARAVKALISTYGIPQTFLSIREYGGPVIETDVRPYWEHDRFVYHVRLASIANGGVTNGSYITVPWGKIDDVDENGNPTGISITPDAVELQVQQDVNQTTTIIDSRTNSRAVLPGFDNMASDWGVVYESTSSNATYKRGNIHFYLNGSQLSGAEIKSASIMDVPLFDGKMSTLIVERENSTDDITQNNTYKIQYRRAHKDRITISRSASISIDGSSESGYNAAWTGSATNALNQKLWIGSQELSNSLPLDGEPLEGALQEIRYWASPLKDIVIDEHTLSRETYHGNSPTSSFYDLKLRLIPDSQIKNWPDYDSGDVSTYVNYLDSSHPNQQITENSGGIELRGTFVAVDNSMLRGVTEEYYTKVPSAGANNILNNKVRVEQNTLTGILDPNEKKEKSQYDSAPVDSNVVGVYLSATRMYNEDIYNHTGYFDIDDYIGNPDKRAGYTEQNEELDYLRREVFKKYSNKNLINNTIDILAKYDMSVFEQIRQTMPARVDYNSGILIEPHILERPKVKSLTKVTQTRPMYDGTIEAIDKPVTSSYIFYETEVPPPYVITADQHIYTGNISNQYTLSADNTQYDGTIDTSNLRVITAQKDDLEELGNPQIRNMYESAAYRYVILNYSQSADLGYGLNWTTGSNGYWNYNVTATSVTGSRVSQYAKKKNWFYSNAISASLGLSNSSSYSPAEVSTDELPLAVQNLRYLGCKMTSDSLTTNSPDTPDGRPVIEIFTADPNVLIYTSQTADEGNLDVDTSTGLSTLDVTELAVNDDIYWKRLQEYKAEVQKFRQKIEKMIEIEDNRAAEFDARYEAEKQRRDKELERRTEFVIQNGDTVEAPPPPPPPLPISSTR
jgi:hypothetical protein